MDEAVKHQPYNKSSGYPTRSIDSGALKLFQASLPDAKLWRNILTAISTLVEEADFNASPEGIKLRSMDPSHVAMVDFEWPKSAFEKFTCSEPKKIRVNLGSMLKLLKRTKSDETLEISYDDATKKVGLLLKGKITKRFALPTLESVEEEVPTPKIVFNSKVKMTTESLRDVIEDAQSISDNVRLETTPEKFLVSTSTELSSANMEIEKGSEAMLEMNVKEPSKATFNLNYLANIVRAGSSASEIVTMEFSTNNPIKVEFEMPQQGRLLYYLAPRIEAE
jgi:proliferating cell nuclear antigen